MSNPPRDRLAELAADAEPMPEAGPGGPPADLLAPWTVAEARDRLLHRIAPPGGSGPIAFPWPGCPSGWPRPHDLDREGRYAAGCLLPPPSGVQRADWRELWNVAGPLAPDRLAVVVGRTGSGKTAFAVQAAEAVAAGGWPVLYASAELGPDELLARLLCLRARRRVPWATVLGGWVSPVDVEEAADHLAGEAPGLYLWAPPSTARTSADLHRMAAELVNRHGKPPLVVLDYVQRWGVGSASDRRNEVSDLAAELRNLSRPHPPGWPGAAVLALSSTGRQNYHLFASTAALAGAYYDDPGQLVGTGKESGDLEYDAPLLLALVAGEAPARDAPAPALVAAVKVRELRPGLVGMGFDGARGWWEYLPGALDEARKLGAEQRQAARQRQAGKGKAAGKGEARPAWGGDFD